MSTGKLKTLAVDLKPELGVIHFKVEPADAQLIVDGKKQGEIPPELKLVAVSHQIEIRKQGYKPHQTQITPRPGYPQEIKITLNQTQIKTDRSDGRHQGPKRLSPEADSSAAFYHGIFAPSEQGRRSATRPFEK